MLSKRLACLLFLLPSNTLAVPTTHHSTLAFKRDGPNGKISPNGTCKGTNYAFYTHWDITGLLDCWSFSEALSLTLIATSPIHCTNNNTSTNFNSPWGMATELEGIFSPYEDGPVYCDIKYFP